jgi:hypothetical protein
MSQRSLHRSAALPRATAVVGQGLGMPFGALAASAVPQLAAEVLALQDLSALCQ